MPPGGQRGDELALRARDALEIADLLQVHRADVRDHADVRPGERAQLGDLAEAAHRQLEDAELGVRLDAAERERARRSRRCSSRSAATVRRCGAQSAARMSLVEVLPIEPVIADEPRAAPVAHRPASAARAAKASSGDERRPRLRGRARRSTNSAPAADRDEQVAVLDPARVGLEARDLVGPRRACEPPGAQLATSSSASGITRSPAARAAPRARPRGRRTGRAAGELLALLVALAGDQDDVARLGELDRALDRRARGRARPRARASTPARISSMIASGSSLRGLSEVTIATSASSEAIRPISGRLPRSRSPPQPKTQITRPVASSRAVRSTFSSASGLCA